MQRKGQVAQSLFMALTHIAFASHVCYIAIPYIATKLYVANKKCVPTPLECLEPNIQAIFELVWPQYLFDLAQGFRLFKKTINTQILTLFDHFYLNSLYIYFIGVVTDHSGILV